MWHDDGSANLPLIGNRFRAEGQHLNGMITKQTMEMMPQQGSPKSALGDAIDELDAMVQALGSRADSVNSLLSQARATNIDPDVTMAMMQDVEKFRGALLSLTPLLNGIRSMHMNLVQHGPPTMMPDPMMAASQQQAPMNMPPADQTAQQGGM